MNCPKCGKQSPAAAKNCSYCDTPLSPPTASMYCRMCGSKIPEDSKFCTNCGTEVKHSDSEPVDTIPIKDTSYRYIPPKDHARDVIRNSKESSTKSYTQIPQQETVFCTNCGTKQQKDMKFCINCGKQLGGVAENSVSSQTTTAPTQSKSKRSIMKTIAIVLIVLNIIAAIGGMADGDIVNMLNSGMPGLFELAGFFAPAIIACILLAIDKKR